LYWAECGVLNWVGPSIKVTHPINPTLRAGEEDECDAINYLGGPAYLIIPTTRLVVIKRRLLHGRHTFMDLEQKR
jgi:hypothetical protein